jgi:dolichol-phosphate mannosyltransferase
MDGLGDNSDHPMSDSRPALSVVIPFFNEAPNIEPLLAELRAALGGLAIEAEVLCIDDGSADTTHESLARAAQTWPAVRVQHFSKNRGQAAALWWGFQNSRGLWIGMLDGDGQNPPAEFGKLWALRETADMISGARVGRRDPC